jgi:hypothetical protein
MVNPIKLWKSKKYIEEIQKDLNNMSQTNWKTSLFGIISCVIALALIWAPAEFQQKLLDTQSQLTVLFSLLGVGLILSKDHNK